MTDNTGTHNENYYREIINSLLKENQILKKQLQKSGESESVPDTVCNEQLNSKENLILRTLINTANKNVLRQKPG